MAAHFQISATTNPRGWGPWYCFFLSGRFPFSGSDWSSRGFFHCPLLETACQRQRVKGTLGKPSSYHLSSSLTPRVSPLALTTSKATSGPSNTCTAAPLQRPPRLASATSPRSALQSQRRQQRYLLGLHRSVTTAATAVNTVTTNGTELSVHQAVPSTRRELDPYIVTTAQPTSIDPAVSTHCMDTARGGATPASGSWTGTASLYCAANTTVLAACARKLAYCRIAA